MTEYTPEQIQENRRKWLEALRSGEFKQTTGVLARQNDDGKYGYCCLGVACEISGVASRDLTRGYDDRVRKVYGENEADLTLPEEVRAWLGVETDSPNLASPVVVNDDGDDETGLTILNDDYGFTFEQIADAIEQNGLA